ncbi:MAG: hypothetical protein IJ277_00320 [Bacteroidaceae bacterium]|nr:hypothetical protein [Bacteroidaceae bacterium]
MTLSDSKSVWAFDTTTIPGYVAICYNNTSGTAIAANTAILLRGTPSSVVELVISENGSQYKTNRLLPVVAATVPAADVNAYTLVCDGDAVSFRKIEGSHRMLPAHSCYLVGNNANVQTISVVFSGKETGIDFVTATPQTPSGIYNVHGQQLRAPQRGINIIDGKKVLVK